VRGDDVAEHAETAKAVTTVPTSGSSRNRRPRAGDSSPFEVDTPTSHHAGKFRLSARGHDEKAGTAPAGAAPAFSRFCRATYRASSSRSRLAPMSSAPSPRRIAPAANSVAIGAPVNGSTAA
jgi:hypothetical protein